MERLSIIQGVNIFFRRVQEVEYRIAGEGVQPFTLSYIAHVGLIGEQDNHPPAARPGNGQRRIQMQPVVFVHRSFDFNGF